jgi:hypothetical protein
MYLDRFIFLSQNNWYPVLEMLDGRYNPTFFLGYLLNQIRQAVGSGFLKPRQTVLGRRSILVEFPCASNYTVTKFKSLQLMQTNSSCQLLWDHAQIQGRIQRVLPGMPKLSKAKALSSVGNPRAFHSAARRKQSHGS